MHKLPIRKTSYYTTNYKNLGNMTCYQLRTFITTARKPDLLPTETKIDIKIQMKLETKVYKLEQRKIKLKLNFFKKETKIDNKK